MKLLSAIAISIAAAAAVAAVVMRYVAANAAVPSFWQRDPIALLWRGVGGPAVIALLIFALVAFLLVTAGLVRDMSIARGRLKGDGPHVEPGPPDWAAVFAGTVFAPIADQLVAEEFRTAPLSLLRLVRVEIWRIYAKQLISIEILAIATGAVLALATPAWLVAPSAAAASGWELSALLLLLAAMAGAWLLVDAAIDWLSGAITRGAAAWPQPAAMAMPSSAGADPSLARLGSVLDTLERLIAALAARPDPTARLASELALARAALKPLIERIDERLVVPPPQASDVDRSAGLQAVAGLTEALADIACAMEKLSTAGAGGRWDELEAAVRGMGERLDGITAAIQAQPPRLSGPRTVTDRLEELIEEISGP